MPSFASSCRELTHLLLMISTSCQDLFSKSEHCEQTCADHKTSTIGGSHCSQHELGERSFVCLREVRDIANRVWLERALNVERGKSIQLSAWKAPAHSEESNWRKDGISNKHIWEQQWKLEGQIREAVSKTPEPSIFVIVSLFLFLSNSSGSFRGVWGPSKYWAIFIQHSFRIAKLFPKYFLFIPLASDS